MNLLKQLRMQQTTSMKYVVRNKNGHYLYKVNKTNGWYYFTDNKDRAKEFTKEEATQLAKEIYGGEVEPNERTKKN